MNETLSWALKYAELGWAVFPIHGIVDGQCTCGAKDCPDAGKHPILRNGEKGATSDVEKIKSWFCDHPSANVAIATGKRSGITVFDIDIADGKTGAKTWASATEECGEPETLIAITGSGGRHVLCRYNSAIPSTTDWIGKGLDVRNDGGYIVVAPSAHRCGGHYEWENWGTQLADIPTQLAAPRRKAKSGRKRSALTAKQAEQWLACIPADDRTTWRNVGIILGREFNRSDEGWELYVAWSDKWGGKKGRNHDAIMREAYHELSQQDGGLSAATLLQLARDNGWEPEGGCILPSLTDDARAAAEKFYHNQFFSGDHPTIIYWAQEWFCRYKGLWQQRSEDEVDRFISERLANCSTITKRGEVRPFSTAPATVTSMRQLLTHVIKTPSPATTTLPLQYIHDNGKDTWRWAQSEFSKGSIHCRGEIVDIASGVCQPNDDIFSPNGAPWEWDAEAGCPEWMAFLESIFGRRHEEIALLQQWMGYLLSGDVDQQRGLILTGPTRAGKGIISQIITSLLGIQAVAAPTLASLGTEFGLQQLMHKRLCLLTDARISRRADVQAVVEQLLKVIADDPVSVARKFKSAIVMRLGVRVMIASNELPNLYDSSPAINKRFMLLKLEKSWYDKEDLTLLERLKTELPGIANWAREGYIDLMSNRRFSVPDSSKQAVEEWWEESSPINSFSEECLDFDRHARVAATDLYTAYKAWCEYTGARLIDRRQLTKAICGAYDPKIKSVKSNGTRYLKGIKLVHLPGERHKIDEAGKVITMF